MLPTTVLCYPLKPQLTRNMLPTIVLCYPLNLQLTCYVICQTYCPQQCYVTCSTHSSQVNMLFTTVLCYPLKPQLTGIKLPMTKYYITTKTFQMEKSLLTLPLEKPLEALIFLFA